MNTYIATFFNHFGAFRFKRLCESHNIKAETMPVPRTLSSSCGTCVKYDALEALLDPSHDEMEKTVLCLDDSNYLLIYQASDC